MVCIHRVIGLCFPRVTEIPLGPSKPLFADLFTWTVYISNSHICFFIHRGIGWCIRHLTKSLRGPSILLFTDILIVCIHAPSSRHLRALLGVCGRCSFGGLGCCSCRVCVCRCRGCCSLSVCVYVTCRSFYREIGWCTRHLIKSLRVPSTALWAASPVRLSQRQTTGALHTHSLYISILS